MSLTQVAAGTMFYPTPDGRIVFRPWGRKGPCYLLTPAQRDARARWQLAYWALMLVAIVGVMNRAPRLGPTLATLAAVILGNYALLWAFARGLPLTDPPSPPTKEYRDHLLSQHARAFGRPMLWIMLALSVGMSLLGAVAGISASRWDVAALAGGFFGLCAGVFGWQLRRARGN
jgi:hypothetical protein